MNITRFIEYLNKERGLHLDAAYYAYIDTWRQWWRGYVPTVHDMQECTADGTVHKRRLAGLRMPKHACEDWASLLLNDKTTVTLEDAASAEWLLGNEDQTGGQLRQMEFWPNANRLVELAFRSGTGAFVLSVDGLRVANGTVQSSPGAKLCLDYDPAECILPITVQHGVITEVAFASEVMADGHSCIYLQTHCLVAKPDGGKQYRITNDYFTSTDSDSESAGYQEAPLPEGIAKAFCTGSDVPLFAVFSPAEVKNLPGGPGLGMAVFSEAMDAAAHVDLAFDNYRQDIYLGGKKVFYNKRLVRSWVGRDGKEHFATPDALRRQQFYQLPEEDPDAAADWHEYNPDLRVEANSQAVQDALNYFGFKCGLGCHHWRFTGDGAVKTATEYTGDRQDMVQHANRHQIPIEAALIRIFRAMLWAGRDILGEPVTPDTEITVNFDDSYITDADTRRAQDKQDALDGFIPKYRYLMEWYGLSKEDAQHTVQEAQEEAHNSASERLTFP